MIKLNRLTLNNFMCVEHAELDFSDGVTLIVGSNGQGKSTVLQAVTLCLLEDKRSDSYKEFIMLGKDNASVSLDAEISGIPIKINIIINKKASGMERNATYNGRVYNNSEVSDLLSSFDLKYYADIIMSMQNEGDITKLKPAEREAYLQKLFQFDFTKKVDNLKEELNEIKSSIDYQNAQIDFNSKTILDRQKEIKELQPLSFSDNDISELNNKIKVLNTELSDAAEQLKIKDELLKKKSILQNTEYSIKQDISKLNHEIELIKSNQGMIDTLKQKVLEYDESSKKLELDKGSYNSSIIELRNKVQVLNTEKDSLNTEIKNQHDEYLAKSSELSELNVLFANKDVELKHAQKHVDMVKLGTCPECGHTFDRMDNSKYNSALETAMSEKSSVEIRKQKKQEEVSFADANVKALREKLRNKEIEISNVTKDINTFEYKIKTVDDQIRMNNSSMARIEEQINQYSTSTGKVDSLNTEISVNTKKLEDLKVESDSLDQQLSSLYDITKQYMDKQSELMSLQNKISEYNNEITQNNVILQNNENIKKSIEDMTKQIDESKKMVEGYRRQKDTYDEAITILDKTFPAWLILKTCQMLEQEMNNFIQVVFPQMSVKLFQNKRGVEFFYTTDMNNGRLQTKENLLNAKMASGFEKAILSIAFKVALCRAYNLRFAFMDEIDQAGTEENSESLFKAILSNDLFDQLFVISHKPTVRDVIQSFAPSLKTFYVSGGKFSNEE